MKEEKIIVSLTTWHKRINNLPIVLDSIYNQLTTPDIIVINLSIEDFPNKVLPKAVKEYIDKQNEIIPIDIIWHQDNKKVFKKLIPTLLKYKDDVVISIDDDFIYPCEMIYDLIDTHKKYPNNPISGNRVNLFGINCHCGCCSLTKYEYFGDYINEIPNEVIKEGADDIYYTYIATILNNRKYIHPIGTYYTNMPSIKSMDSYTPTDTLKANTIIFNTMFALIKRYNKVWGTIQV